MVEPVTLIGAVATCWQLAESFQRLYRSMKRQLRFMMHAPQLFKDLIEETRLVSQCLIILGGSHVGTDNTPEEIDQTAISVQAAIEAMSMVFRAGEKLRYNILTFIKDLKLQTLSPIFPRVIDKIRWLLKESKYRSLQNMVRNTKDNVNLVTTSLHLVLQQGLIASLRRENKEIPKIFEQKIKVLQRQLRQQGNIARETIDRLRAQNTFTSADGESREAIYDMISVSRRIFELVERTDSTSDVNSASEASTTAVNRSRVPIIQGASPVKNALTRDNHEATRSGDSAAPNASYKRSNLNSEPAIHTGLNLPFDHSFYSVSWLSDELGMSDRPQIPAATPHSFSGSDVRDDDYSLEQTLPRQWHPHSDDPAEEGSDRDDTGEEVCESEEACETASEEAEENGEKTQTFSITASNTSSPEDDLSSKGSAKGEYACGTFDTQRVKRAVVEDVRSRSDGTSTRSSSPSQTGQRRPRPQRRVRDIFAEIGEEHVKEPKVEVGEGVRRAVPPFTQLDSRKSRGKST